MAERLTNTLEETLTLGFGLKFCSDRNCNSDEDCCNCYAFNQTINKLRQLEDIMEKYNIEGVSELDEILDELKQELNVWRKACELACENISTVKVITNEDMSKYSNYLPNYFYEKSKKELENKNEQ